MMRDMSLYYSLSEDAEYRGLPHSRFSQEQRHILGPKVRFFRSTYAMIIISYKACLHDRM